MARSPLTRREVFDRTRALLEAVSGLTYVDKTGEGDYPSTRASAFTLGGRTTDFEEAAFRGVDGGVISATHTFAVAFFNFVKPADREERRNENDDKMDAIHRGLMGVSNSNTYGLEFWWSGEEETQSQSGEWWVIRGTLQARCLFDLT